METYSILVICCGQQGCSAHQLAALTRRSSGIACEDSSWVARSVRLALERRQTAPTVALRAVEVRVLPGAVVAQHDAPFLQQVPQRRRPR